MHERGHGRRRYQDHEDGESQDRSELATKIAQRKGGSAPIEQRRNEDQEQDIGRQLEPRQIGHEREHQSADDEQRRVWNREAPREDSQTGGHGEEEQDELEAIHASKDRSVLSEKLYLQDTLAIREDRWLLRARTSIKFTTSNRGRPRDARS